MNCQRVERGAMCNKRCDACLVCCGGGSVYSKVPQILMYVLGYLEYVEYYCIS